ncbi:MAG TPA: transposase, partial [Candidatus Acidoferrum sp.]|nr:transposase [Candidatus Acidoferrum sp.]
SAREVARRCEFDPAFQWLTGLDEVNYHTLADFRVEKQKELDELFTQVVGGAQQRRTAPVGTSDARRDED